MHGLSRIVEDEDACPNYLSGVRLKNLPYRRCRYCQKAHAAWTEYILDVDEAVPLTKRKRAYNCQLREHVVDVSTSMIQLFGGELPKLDSSSQDDNLTSGLDVQVDSAQSRIAVPSEGIIQITTIRRRWNSLPRFHHG